LRNTAALPLRSVGGEKEEPRHVSPGKRGFWRGQLKGRSSKPRKRGGYGTKGALMTKWAQRWGHAAKKQGKVNVEVKTRERMYRRS